MNNEQGLNEHVAADVLGLKVSTMRKYRMEGRGPVYHKFGKKVTYYREDLNDYRARHRVEPRGAAVCR